jgi:hypothetical protein
MLSGIMSSMDEIDDEDSVVQVLNPSTWRPPRDGGPLHSRDVLTQGLAGQRSAESLQPGPKEESHASRSTRE